MDIDSSEEARAAGERQCDIWWPVYLLWADNHANDLEIQARAAYMDGFRQALKEVARVNPKAVQRALNLPPSAPRLRPGARTNEEKRLRALRLADLGQELGS